MREPRRLNRFVLFLLGVALVAGSVLGLLLSFDVFGTGRARRPVLDPQVRSFVADHHDPLWAAVAVGGVIVALLGLAWLRAQLHAPRAANTDVTRTAGAGSTVLSGGAVADALGAEVESYPGVTAAAARVHGEDIRPEVDLFVKVADDADIAGLRQRIRADALSRVCQALEVDAVRATVEFRLVGPEGRQVA